MEFVRRHDLDGFDVDWEYPGLPGAGNVAPARGQGELHRRSWPSCARPSTRRARSAAGSYLLTFAAGAVADFLEHTEMDKVQASVDYVNLMTYDFRGPAGRPPGRPPREPLREPRRPPAALRRPRGARVPGRGRARRASSCSACPSTAAPGARSSRPGRRPLPAGPGRPRSGSTTQLRQPGRPGHEPGWVRRGTRLAQAPFLWNAEKRIFVSLRRPGVAAREVPLHPRARASAGAMFWEYGADPTGALLDTLFTELRGADAPRPLP